VSHALHVVPLCVAQLEINVAVQALAAGVEPGSAALHGEQLCGALVEIIGVHAVPLCVEH
jgi:hypothetical protein